MLSQHDLYEQDFYAWTQEQAGLLRQGKFEALDSEHIAEKMESLGISLRRELRSRLIVLLVHRLKWDKQPEHRSRSWKVTIIHQQQELMDLLEESPSLRSQLPEILAKAYPRAVRQVVEETEIYHSLFPPQYPWTVEELLQEDFAQE